MYEGSKGIVKVGDDGYCHFEKYDDAEEKVAEEQMKTSIKVVIFLGIIAGIGLLVTSVGLGWHFGSMAHISVLGHAIPSPSIAQWVTVVVVGAGTTAVSLGTIIGIKGREFLR